MRQCVIILVLILFATSAGADIIASLEVSSHQDIPGGPYRRAELTAENSSVSTVETVLLKPAGGGLTVRYKLTVPSGLNGKQTVLLPAISPTQEYAVVALDASGEVVGRTSASITWPAKLVTTDAFINNAFRAWTDEPARWSAKIRWNYLLVPVMFVTAAIATLFIRRPIIRVVVVVVISAAVTVLLVFVLIPAGPEEVRVHRCELFLHDNAAGFQSDSFAVLSSRRTTTWSFTTTSLPYPVYPDHHAAGGDDTVVEPASSSIHLTLRPGQVRITRPSPSYLKPDTPWRGSIRQETGGFTVETDFIFPTALLIRNDSIWWIGSEMVAQEASVRTDRAESYGAFIGGEGGRKLNHHARRLLNYWRDRHQRSNEFYLVEPSSGEAGDNMTVVRLDEVSAW